MRTFGTSLDLAYLLASEGGAVVTDDRGAPWNLGSDSLVAAADPMLHLTLLKLQMDNLSISTDAVQA
jgi:hypothetical protein